MSEVLLEVIAIGKGGNQSVAVITLNRPSAKNAISRPLAFKLAEILGEVREMKDVRAMVLIGSGGTFSAGVDLKDPLFADASLMTEAAFNGPKNYAWQLQQVQVPRIAAVAGACITGGMELALNCDIIIASETAFFQDTHTRYGIVPGAGMTSILPKSIGLHAAKWMSLTGARISAHRAHELGLVAKVVPSDAALREEALAAAAKVCACDADMTRQVRGMIHEGFGADADAALAREGAIAISAYEKMAREAAATRSGLAAAFRTASKL